MNNELILGIILFCVIVVFFAYILYLKKKITSIAEEFEEQKEKLKKEALDRSRPILKGDIAEQIVPFLKDFKYHPADARFLGAPVDYIIYDGMTEGKPITVVLADIKTGKRATLNPPQKRIKEAMDLKRVKWETIHLKLE